MTVAYVSAGTIGAGTTSVTPSAPASLANGDGVLIELVVKPDTATVVVPDKWTLVCDVAGGGGTTGAAVGPTRQVHLFREKTAAFTAMPTITVTGGSGVAAQAYRFTKAAGTDWDVAGASGAYGTAGTVTNAVATLGSDPGITSGDMVLVGASSMSVTPTWSAQTITATGATFGSITERTEALETSNGDDVGGMMFTAAVTAGTASVAATVGGTASAATRGTWALTRLREVTSPARTPPTIVDTKNVASFSTTTSPKTAGTFTAAVGDVLVDGVLDPQDDTGGGGNDNYAWSNTGGAQTWVELTETTGTGIADSWAQAAVAEVISAVTAGDVSVSRSAGDLTTMWGHTAAQFTATDGIGNAASRTGVGGTPSGSITTLKPNSAVMVWMVDYAATNYGTRTWTAINGFAPAAGAGEVAYFRDGTGTVYTLAVAIYPDVGTAGSKTFGLSSPTTGDWQWVAVEVMGVVSAGTVPVTATRATTWNVDATVSATRATTWDTRGVVSGTRATSWDALTPATAARATTWNARAAITSARSTTWRVRGGVTGTRATTWDVLTPAATTRATTWDTRTSVTSTRSTTWDVRTPATSSRATTWNVDGTLAQVTATRPTTWRTTAAIATSRATTWDTLTPASTTRPTTWRVRGSVAGTRSTTWRARALTTGTHSTTWDALAVVTGTRPTAWDTTAAISRQLATTWDIRTAVTAQRSSSWNVDSTMVSVTATRVTTWRTLARPAAARATTWDTRLIVANVRPTAWDVRTITTINRDTNWRILTAPTRTSSTTWRALALVAGDRTTAWDVLSDLVVPPPPRIIAADLRIPTASGRLAILAGQGDLRTIDASGDLRHIEAGGTLTTPRATGDLR